MKDKPVPNKDHISRYCGGSHIHEDGTINGAAFRLRKHEGGHEKFLSVNWLEFLNKKNRNAEISEIRKIFIKKFNRVGSQAKIAVLKVEKLREYISSESPDRRDLKILHEPEPKDPSHSGIFNLKLEDDLIADLIAEIVQEIYPAK